MKAELSGTKLKAILLLALMSAWLFSQISLETAYPSPPSSSLISTLSSLTSEVNWSNPSDPNYLNNLYEGYSLGQVTLSQLQAGIDQCTDWLSTLEFYTICRKYGIENQTKIKWALDAATMMANGLPNYLPSDNFFLVNWRFSLYGYYFANKYSYETDKWNLSKAYQSFRTAVYSASYPAVFYVYGDNSSARGMSYGPRYYDEAGQTMDCFLTFYQLGLTSALQDAVYVWNWTNDMLWNPSPPHFNYARAYADWECEAGGFLQLATRLQYLCPSAGNTNRLHDDIAARFLSSEWSSPQWLCDVVVHHNPSNNQTRLGNTIMAWTALLAIQNLYSSDEKTNMTNLMIGYSGTPAAWYLLFNTQAGLYDSGTNMFRAVSMGPATQHNTADASCLLLNLGIVPMTASLAIPLEELCYEYLYAMVDHDIFNINMADRIVRVGIASPGSVSFLFNQTVTATFDASGLYDVMFSADWNSVTLVNYVSTLPSNRIYLGDQRPRANLTIVEVEGGTTDLGFGTFTYPVGSSFNVTAIPNKGYAFDHWLLDGEDVGPRNQITVTIDMDHELQAVFTLEQFTLIIKAENGTTGPEPGIYTYSYGSDVSVTATSNDGFLFDYWLLDGAYAGTQATITITMDADHSLEAVFSTNPLPWFTFEGPCYTWYGTGYWVVLQHGSHAVRLVSNFG